MKSRIIVLLICLLTGHCVTGWCVFVNRNMMFRHITNRDGLSQQTAFSIIQDHTGYMWFGTWDGLNRYDGYQFTVFKYDAEKPDSLSQNTVTALFEDSKNRLWVGTQGGLDLYNPDTNNFFHYRSLERDKNSLSNNSITSIVEDEKGYLWIGTHWGLNKFYPARGSFERYFHDESRDGSLSGNHVNTLFIDSQKRLWAGTKNGLNLYVPTRNSFRLFKHNSADPKSLLDNHITSIQEDRHGRIWVGTTAGASRYDQSTGHFTNYVDLPGQAEEERKGVISCIYLDRSGNLWMGTNNGLILYDEKHNTFIAYVNEPGNPKSLTSNQIKSIYEDRQGGLWIGTVAKGLNYYDENSLYFKQYKPNAMVNNSLKGRLGRSIFVDGDYIWFGTSDGGLNLYNRKSGLYKYFNYDPENQNSISSNIVREFIKKDKDHFWVGTYDGLNLLNQKSGIVTRYVHDPDNPATVGSNLVKTLFQDIKGRLWIGFWGDGLDLHDPAENTFTHFKHDPGTPGSLSNDSIMNIYEDRSGNIWICTLGGGLDKYIPATGTFKHYKHNPDEPSSISHNNVMAIYEDQKGRYWVATYYGLNRFDPLKGTFQHFTEKDGLGNNVVYCILEDDQGCLWLSTNKGLSRFDPDRIDFTNFDVHDGVQGEYNGGACLKSPEGELFFGGVDGFTAFFPNRIVQNKYPPIVIINDLKIQNKSVKVGEEIDGNVILKQALADTSHIVLSYKNNFITFEFLALHYANPKKNCYAYKLEGFDDEWNYINHRHYATYTNLPPGNYVFKVKAANNDGVWTKNEAELNITIEPPFWSTWWFRGVIFLILLAVGILVFQLRTYAIRQMNRRLKELLLQRTEQLNSTHRQLVESAHRAGMAEIASEVLHHVGNTLTGIYTSSATIQRKIKRSKVTSLIKLNDMLKIHLDDMATFLKTQHDGKDIAEFYIKLGESLKNEFDFIDNEIEHLKSCATTINDIIQKQEQYAANDLYIEHVNLEQIIDDALVFQFTVISDNDIEVKKTFNETPLIKAEKSKLLNIFLSMFCNAVESVKTNDAHKKRWIHVETGRVGRTHVYINISDNGCGIADEHLKKIFMQNLESRKGVHGLSLHSCANFMEDMGGAVTVESGGAGKGAQFSLLLPIERPQE
jgi:ligand-binding sensor domain-containing protein/signal transduction histidine kinase